MCWAPFCSPPAPGQSLLSPIRLRLSCPLASLSGRTFYPSLSFSRWKLRPEEASLLSADMQVLCPCQMLPLTFSLLLNPHCFRILPSYLAITSPETLLSLSTEAHWQASVPATLAFICIWALSTWTALVCIHLRILYGSTATETHPVKLCYTPPHISSFCNNVVFSGCHSERGLAGPWPLWRSEGLAQLLKELLTRGFTFILNRFHYFYFIFLASGFVFFGKIWQMAFTWPVS